MQSYKKKKRNIQIFQIKTFKNRIDSIEDKKRPNFFSKFRLPVCEALRLPFPAEVPCPGNPKAFKKNVKAFEVKREGVLVKIPRRFRKVCITSHIPILPQQDTISYRHKISNLTATRLVIFRRKLVGDRSERRYKSSCHRKQPMIQKVRLR